MAAGIDRRSTPFVSRYVSAANANGAIAAVALTLLIVLTRWPLAPQYLYYFDSVNFALALREFDPALHQPQPPGYPLFVGMTRLLHLIFPGAENTLLAAGVLASIAAVLLLWRLGSEMFGRSAGILAASLLLFNPVFWFGALTNQVRLCLAFCSVAIALLAWRSLQSGSAVWLYLAFSALGISAGFRPALGLVMLPLLLWVWLRAGASPVRLMCAFAASVASASPWITVVSLNAGGVQAWLALMWGYANEQFGGSSAAFGASIDSARLMARKAVVWNGLGTLPWLWALPFCKLRVRDSASLQRGIFVALWFLPVFGFSAVIHIGDPDQALASIPALCLLGGAVLASFLNRIGSRAVVATAAAVACANALLFFFPPRGIARASGYAAVAERDADTRQVIETIQQIQAGGPLTIIHCGASITWRQLSYYFPNAYVVYAPERYSGRSYTLLDNRVVQGNNGGAGQLSFEQFVLVPGSNLKQQDLLAAGWVSRGAVYHRLPAAGEVSFGRYILTPHNLTLRTQ